MNSFIKNGVTLDQVRSMLGLWPRAEITIDAKSALDCECEYLLKAWGPREHPTPDKFLLVGWLRQYLGEEARQSGMTLEAYCEAKIQYWAAREDGTAE